MRNFWVETAFSSDKRTDNTLTNDEKRKVSTCLAYLFKKSPALTESIWSIRHLLFINTKSTHQHGFRHYWQYVQDTHAHTFVIFLFVGERCFHRKFVHVLCCLFKISVLWVLILFQTACSQICFRPPHPTPPSLPHLPLWVGTTKRNKTPAFSAEIPHWVPPEIGPCGVTARWRAYLNGTRN